MKILIIATVCKSKPERVRLLKDALKSVEDQTVQAYEIKITECICSDMNKAVKESDCDAFIMLNDDDKLHPEFIEKTELVMKQTGVDIVYTDCQNFGMETHRWNAGDWTSEIDNQNPIFVTSLCKKLAWEKAGGFGDNDEIVYIDWHFWWRCFHTGATAEHLKEPLFLRRSHQNNWTKKLDNTKARQQILGSHEKLMSKFGPYRDLK
jgi:Glycosyl transferase family 2